MWKSRFCLWGKRRRRNLPVKHVCVFTDNYWLFMRNVCDVFHLHRKPTCERLKNEKKLSCTRIKVQILIQPLDLLHNALVCMSVKLFHLNDLFLNLFDDLKHLFVTNMHKNKKSWSTWVQLHHHDSKHLEAAVSLHGCNSCSWKKLSVKIEI